MELALEVWKVCYPALALGVSLFLLACRWDRTPGVRRWAERFVARFTSKGGLAWLELRYLLVGVGGVLFAVTTVDYLVGAYACPPSGLSDPVGLLASGQAFLSGGDPFFVQACGLGDPIPYGLAGVLLDTVGVPLGVLGVYLVWDVVALALVPLVWELAGEDRRYVTLLVSCSALYLPATLGQIDAAANTLVPVTLLLSIWLQARDRRWAAVVGGFLSTARFPTLFAVLGSTGRLGKDRFWVPALAAATFAAVSLLTYAVWGSGFLDRVFLSQVTRATASENYFGVLIANGWTPSGYVLPAVQAALTLLLVEEVWRRGFAALAGGVVVLLGVELLTNFLSFSILAWMLPLVLLGALAQRGLWLLSLVGTLNYDLAFNYFQQGLGIAWPGEVLDLATTAVLLVMFVALGRQAAREAAASKRAPSVPRGEGSGRGDG